MLSANTHGSMGIHSLNKVPDTMKETTRSKRTQIAATHQETQHWSRPCHACLFELLLEYGADHSQKKFGFLDTTANAVWPTAHIPVLLNRGMDLSRRSGGYSQVY